MSIILRKLLIICLVSLYTVAPLLANELSSLHNALKVYEAKGDWKHAYPIARFLTQKTNTYLAWSDLAAKYADFDTTGKNYLQAWRWAARIDQIDTYRDFMAIRSGTVMNQHAIRAIYRLVRATEDISKLIWFIEIYPDRVETIEAVLAIHELAFAKAKQRDDPEVYDAFIATFPEAKQVNEAMELAFKASMRQLQTDNANLSTPEARERLARRILNQGRKAESTANKGSGSEAPEHPEHIVPITAARNYKLLEEFPPFEDTETLTSILDRHERIAYQKLVLSNLQMVAAKIEATQDAIVDALTAQTAAIDLQREQLAAAIENQTGVIKAVGERLVTEMQQQTTTLTAAIDRVTVAVGKVETAVNTQGERMTIAIGRVETAVNTQGERITTAIGRVEASVNNVGTLINAHNQLMDQQLAMIQNPTAAPGGVAVEGGAPVEAGVVDSAISGGVAMACEYAGKIAGGVAGAYASGGAAAVVGSHVGGMASRYACEAIAKLGQKIKDKAHELAQKAKAKIAAIGQGAVKAVKKAWGKIKSWFSDNYIPGREQLVTICGPNPPCDFCYEESSIHYEWNNGRLEKKSMADYLTIYPLIFIALSTITK